jgi:hypothetical protein
MPYQKIANTGETVKRDLIVIATLGRTGFANALLEARLNAWSACAWRIVAQPASDRAKARKTRGDSSAASRCKSTIWWRMMFSLPTGKVRFIARSRSACLEWEQQHLQPE